MPTRTGIAAVFSRLAVCGCRTPAEVIARPSEAVDAWLSVLNDVSDDDLVAAVGQYLRGDKAQWWPAPGALLALVPRRERRAITAGSPCPTYDALDQDQRAAIGEAILLEARDCIDDDAKLAAECERRARLVRMAA